MIALGSDHGGYDLKCQIEEYLEEKGCLLYTSPSPRDCS